MDEVKDEDGGEREDPRLHALGRWFDGELRGEDAATIERRVREDRELGDETRFLKAVRAAFRSRERLAAGPGFTDRILEAVFPPGADSVWILVGPLVKRLAVAASIVLLVSVGLGLVFFGAPDDGLAAGPIRPSSLERALLGAPGGGGPDAPDSGASHGDTGR